MGRPAKHDKRDQQLNVKLTVREFAWVAREATAVGLRPGEYGRTKMLADRPVDTPARAEGPQLDPLFLASLARIGNNLNQIARRLHELDVPAPEDLAPLLRLVRETLQQAARR
jgi:mobilization protein NikA